MNKNIYLCNKTEIIEKVVKVSEYLAEHQLGNMRKSLNTWKTYKKEDLIGIYMKMLAVIGADMRERAIKDPESVPELKEMVLTRNAAIDAIRDRMKETRDGYYNLITNIIKDWLGDDLTLFVNTSNITIGIPGEHHLDISIYYRENIDWVNHQIVVKEGTLDINQPTFGTWNPNREGDQDAIRFFKTLYLMATDNTGRLESIRKYMDKNYAWVSDCSLEVDRVRDEFKEKAATITGEITMNMEF